jgi:hypothetical protein
MIPPLDLRPMLVAAAIFVALVVSVVIYFSVDPLYFASP